MIEHQDQLPGVSGDDVVVVKGYARRRKVKSAAPVALPKLHPTKWGRGRVYHFPEGRILVGGGSPMVRLRWALRILWGVLRGKQIVLDCNWLVVIAAHKTKVTTHTTRSLAVTPGLLDEQS